MTPQQASALEEQLNEGIVSGIMVFTSAASKRLIAKAVAQLPEVKAAMKKGRIIISSGTTNGFVAEELAGENYPNKSWFTRGHIVDGWLAANGRHPNLIRPMRLVDGKQVEELPDELLKDFGGSDVLIKGGNALDLEGNVGVIVGNPQGGTVGSFAGIVGSRGSHLIAAIGLEKLIPSVPEAARTMGIGKLKYPIGGTVGMLVLQSATVITELEALDILTGVTATHVASGGIAGSEGAVVVTVEGTDAEVKKAFEIWESIKDETPVPHPGSDMSRQMGK